MNNNITTTQVKVAFGVGQMAEGIKNCAVAVFLIFFYTNVMGLSGTLAGSALMIALCFDAVSDPLMGYISDSFKSRWGRRHPFMYGGAIPMAISFYCLFVPPDNLGQAELFIWMTVFTILTRGCMTIYSVPHMAMNAELTNDYGERTTLSALRMFFSMMGFLAVAVASFNYFLRATPEFPKGQLNPAGYPPFALTFAILMVIVIWYSALGTHHTIPFLPQAPKNKKSFSPGRFLADMTSPFRVRSFRVVATGMVFYYIMYGGINAVSLYLYTYFWDFSSQQIGILLPISLLTIALAVPFTRKVVRIIGEKRDTWIICSIWASFFLSLMIFLRLFGLLPENGHPSLFYLVGITVAIGQMGYGVVIALGTSILADLTDEHERIYHTRQEGLYYGAMSLMQKMSSGVGSLLAGVMADFSGISKLRGTEMATPENLTLLGWSMAPVVLVVTLLAVLFIRQYDVDRARLKEILVELAERKSGNVEMAP